MSRPRIVVVGGGLAGLRAAVSCADAGARVTLLEGRTRLGGATWSAQHRGLAVDNGQHVFLRCFDAYLAFLRRLGVEDRVTLQTRLALPVLSPSGRLAWLRRRPLPAPLHFVQSLLGYTHLRPGDRLRVALAMRALSRLSPEDDCLDGTSFGDWLAAQRQSPRAVADFWDLIARPTLNLPASQASLQLAVKVFRTGLLDEAPAGDLGYARVPLHEVHAEPALRALERAGARVRLRTPVRRLEAGPGRAPRVWTAEGAESADAVILAVEHEAAAGLLPAAAGVDRDGLLRLGRSPIVNLHVVYERRVTDLPFVATVGSPVEFAFDRTQASGLARGQYLAISLSAADLYVGASADSLRRRFAVELARIFPAARQARIRDFFVTCERAATFRQAPGTQALRPGALTKAPGLFLAGAWTDTGWPATMEGAVRSGLAAATAALRHVGGRRLPEEAAA